MQPREVSIETYTLCNAACTFCPYPTLERKGQKMSDELLDKLIDEMKDWGPFYFSPFKVNEPLLDKRLESICKRLPHSFIRLFTNGSPLTQRHIDWIGKIPNIVHLWISLNSHKEKEYEQVMSLPFKHTAKRLDNLHRQDFPHPVVLSKVGGDEGFRQYCYDRWPKFKVFIIKKDAWIDYTDAQITQVPDRPCARWEELSITSEGKVALCCMDEGKYSIGDVNKQTMLEVYETLVQRHGHSRLEFDPCKRCTY